MTKKESVNTSRYHVLTRILETHEDLILETEMDKNIPHKLSVNQIKKIFSDPQKDLPSPIQ